MTTLVSIAAASAMLSLASLVITARWRSRYFFGEASLPQFLAHLLVSFTVVFISTLTLCFMFWGRAGK